MKGMLAGVALGASLAVLAFIIWSGFVMIDEVQSEPTLFWE